MTNQKSKKECPKQEKALFLQRFIAYLIDVMFISLLSTLVLAPIQPSKTMQELMKENDKIANQYIEKKISAETYFNQSMDISYELSKQSGLSTIISIGVSILYFVVFSIYHNGQTIGKSLMKIRVVHEDYEKELTMNQLLMRSFIINATLVNIIMLLITLFAGKDIYVVSSYALEGVQIIIVFASAIMAMCRADGRGIQDFLAHTKVVRCEVKEKELEVCES